jgi:hypothetical protein
MDKLTKWLETVVMGLVSQPDLVKVSAVEDEQGVLFMVNVAKEDTGKVIGKKGTIAEAIRVLLRSAGYIEQIRACMKVSAPGSTFELNREV